MPRQTKTRALEDIHGRYGERDGELERSLRDKEEELEISKSAMDQALMELHELRMVRYLESVVYSIAAAKCLRMMATRTKLWTIKLTKSSLETSRRLTT